MPSRIFSRRYAGKKLNGRTKGRGKPGRSVLGRLLAGGCLISTAAVLAPTASAPFSHSPDAVEAQPGDIFSMIAPRYPIARSIAQLADDWEHLPHTERSGFDSWFPYETTVMASGTADPMNVYDQFALYQGIRDGSV